MAVVGREDGALDVWDIGASWATPRLALQVGTCCLDERGSRYQTAARGWCGIQCRGQLTKTTGEHGDIHTMVWSKFSELAIANPVNDTETKTE